MRVDPRIAERGVQLLERLIVGAAHIASSGAILRRHLGRGLSPWLPWLIAMLVSIAAKASADAHAFLRPKSAVALSVLTPVIIGMIVACLLLLAYRSFRNNWAPTELLNELEYLSDDIRPWLTHLRHNAPSSNKLERHADRQDAWEALSIPVRFLRHVRVAEFLLMFYSVVLLLAIESAALTSVVGPKPFCHLDTSSPFLNHMYFVLVSVVTLGPGDISANLESRNGVLFVIGMCCVSLFILAFGLNLFVSGTQKLFEVLDRELDALDC